MAIWPTTRMRVMTLTSRLLLPRPPSFIISEALPRAASKAGTRPETNVARRTAPRVKPRTLASIVNDDPIGELELRRARDLREEINRPIGERDSDDRAEKRNEETFRQHLPDNAPAGRAERAADRQFPRAQGGPAELHVHHVHTGDEEDDDDGAEHRVHDLGQLLAGERLVE